MGTKFYASNIIDAENLKEGDEHFTSSPSFVTRVALAPDNALKVIKGEKIPARIRDSFPYTERLSVLAVMMGNMTIALILVMSVVLSSENMGRNWYVVLLGGFTILFMYLEYWRLLYAKKLRNDIYIENYSTE